MEEADLISWTSGESHLMLNPRLPDPERTRLETLATPLQGHIWLATSGSSGDLKLVALSKNAILASADAVNVHLQADSADRWCRALPWFHIGGLAIHARAFRACSDVIEIEAWNAPRFLEMCERNQVTLSSLVPAQLRDLTAVQIRAPRSLRAVIIGGESLDQDLYHQARRLGWNVLPSYGMTECCSQIATASLRSLEAEDFPQLQILSHLQARIEADGRLAFSGSSLLTGYSDPERGFWDPKVDGWFVSDDHGRIENDRFIEVTGRGSELIKIGGEMVSLARLDQILAEVIRDLGWNGDAAVVAMTDRRLGKVIHLVTSGATETNRLAEEFNRRVLPFERARQIREVGRIPRSALGKLLRAELESTGGS